MNGENFNISGQAPLRAFLLIGANAQSFAEFMVPLAAGGFIYIAGSDLIPELHKEATPSKSLVQLISMGTGVGLMLLLSLLD